MNQDAAIKPNFIRHGLFRLRQSIGRRLEAMKASENPVLRVTGMFMYALWQLGGDSLRWLVSSEFRSIRQLATNSRTDLHQVANFTKMDRYPLLFNACRMYHINKPALRLLSFGCSTGEEVLTLGQYFPQAQIVGVDINPWNIKTAQQRCDQPRMSIYHTDDPAWQMQDGYDAIFCLAVLQRTENRTQNPQSSGEIYPFSRFDHQLTQLDSYLKQEGLMTLDEADYRFEDATVAEHYQPLAWDKPVLKNRDMFDASNQKLSEQQLIHRIYIKKGEMKKGPLSC
ncbi:MAG: class I SAM-dependent methyltransferase [Phycisphaeraceae bacterium]|nr:class I SAM-dependent methyltransferase [Phycisphaeraceae bacterium]